MAYKVGVIGYGWAASAHIDAINGTEQGSVSAVYSSRELDGKELSKKYGSDITTYQSVDDLIKSSDVDTVSITSYPNQHREQAVAAAEAGKNIILEKRSSIFRFCWQILPLGRQALLKFDFTLR